MVVNSDNNKKVMKKSKVKKSLKKKDKSLQKISRLKGLKKKIGQCPICWATLGKNPLASTTCGHVYCLKCLEQALKLRKTCPTCRCPLKKKSGYHPIYLNMNIMSD